MAKYSDEEVKAFERKDQLMSRMAAIKDVATVFEGKGIDTDTILKEADKYYGWIVQGQLWSQDLVPVSSVKTSGPPVPTTKQKEWLDRIQKKHRFTQEQVFEKYGKYPSTKDEALECVRLLKGNL
jgi:hypothetical protein